MMADANASIVRGFDRAGDHLVVGGITVEEIASRVGTPFFVYDTDRMDHRLRLLRDALPDRFDVYYSIKANPAQGILRFFLERGCGLEVASAGELHQALAAGCSASRVLFAGPGKTTGELEYAARQEVGEIHVEGFDEIDELSRIAAAGATPILVAIRVNPRSEAQGGAMRMGGKPAVFGIDEERLDEAVDRVLARPGLELAGVHLFAGTLILDWEVLAAQYRKGVEIGLKAAARSGLPLRTLDFGGGLGIPYYAGDAELDIRAYGRAVSELIDETGPRPELANTRFLVEPGRYLVGDSGVYVTRVISVKRSRGKVFVVVDGGMHHHLAASGNLGQVIKRNFPLVVANRMGQATALKADVAGPLCTPLDVLGRNVELPNVEAGDLVAVLQSGAYARAASPLGFLSHPAPPEVAVAAGRARLIRRRSDHEATLADQCDERL